MPCRCDDVVVTGPSYDYTRIRRKLDEATRLLCYLCGEIEYDSQWPRYDCPALRKWREHHRRRDEARVMRRMSAALSKRLVSPDKLAKKFIDRASAVHPVSRWHKKWFLDMAKEACRRRGEEIAKKKLKADVVRKALGKLSPEERKALGI